MTVEGVPDDFDQSVKRQILAAYGYTSEAELNAAIEEELPGYLAAHAEWEAEKAAFSAELQGRMEEAAAAVTTWGQAHGMLPDGVELAPIDLEADAQWIAPAPQQFTGILAALNGEYTLPPRCTSTFTETPEPRDVLASIDSAIEDWELGPDAMRWSSEHPEMPETFTEITFDTRPAPSVNAGAIRMASEFQRQTEALVEGRLLARALEEYGLLDGFIATVSSACESVLALARTLSIEPWPHGWNEPCFCHPKPFPAARDYRRRTKHRNHRRKL